MPHISKNEGSTRMSGIDDVAENICPAMSFKKRVFKTSVDDVAGSICADLPPRQQRSHPSWTDFLLQKVNPVRALPPAAAATAGAAGAPAVERVATL